MTQFRAIPTYTVPIQPKDNTAASWYRYFQDLDTGRPPEDVEPLTVTASPFVVHQSDHAGFLIVKGGTVSKIEFYRGVSNTTGPGIDIGVVAGCLPMGQEDSYKITYTVVPTVTFVPM
jgi:hypothetical protein